MSLVATTFKRARRFPLALRAFTPRQGGLVPVSSKEFSYSKGEFTAFASDLGEGAVGYVETEDNSLAWGIAVRSARTGAVAVYAEAMVEVSADGDYLASVYLPLKDQCPKEALKTRLVVFND